MISDLKSSDLLSDYGAGCLRSYYFRNSIYKKQLSYDGTEFQYSPIKDSLESLLKKKSVQNEYQCTKFLVYHGNHKPGEEKVFHNINPRCCFQR